MKELLVFDLDGTLLDGDERLTDTTRKALGELDRLGINWTVATGRMPHGALESLPNIHFKHPQVYKNGVLLWDLNEDKVISKIPMAAHEVEEVCARLKSQGINPWLNTIDHKDNIGAIISAITTPREIEWSGYLKEQGILVQENLELSNIKDHVLNIFAATENANVLGMAEACADIEGVSVFAGHDMYKSGSYWLDIHHSAGTKGDAVKIVQEQLGAEKIICFGDSDNDFSMFEIADESYAMGQGLAELKAMATATIGPNSEDSIAHFLADRYGFSLD
ncbi:Cof-type HAD-IIB family hydrolase [Reinekea forsetii]|nr:Cof-type HAD-IIB family hydrolase [Reinekea forsetii]